MNYCVLVYKISLEAFSILSSIGALTLMNPFSQCKALSSYVPVASQEKRSKLPLENVKKKHRKQRGGTCITQNTVF